MTRNEFIDEVYVKVIESYGKENLITKKKLRMVVDSIIKTSFDILSSGGRVSFTGFGTLEVKEYSGRRYLDFDTGEEKMSNTKHKVRFIPAAILEESISKLDKRGE